MNNLFVCSSLGGGGAERVAVNLANSLVSLGHSVTIFSRKECADCYAIDPKVRLIFPDKYGFVNCIFFLRRAIDSGDYDVVISFTDVPNIVSYMSARLSKNKPLFFPTIHTNLVSRDKRSKQDLRFQIVRFLHKQACRYAQKVVAVSEGARESLVSYYGVRSSNAVTIYNPVFADSGNFIFRKTIQSTKSVKLVAAGRLTEAKNYYMMIDVVRKLNALHGNEYTLDIYGKGELSEDLQSYAIRRGVGSKVRFKGFVDNLKSRLSDYDIFLFTSDWEGFGNVLVEALSAGISVVSTDCTSGPSEILCGGKFGRLVDVGDVDGFVQAVDDEVKHPLKFDIQSLVHHLNKFRQDVVANKYVELVINAQ